MSQKQSPGNDQQASLADRAVSLRQPARLSCSIRHALALLVYMYSNVGLAVALLRLRTVRINGLSPNTNHTITTKYNTNNLTYCTPTELLRC